MSNTQHSAMRDAVVAALLAAPALASGRIEARRRRPVAAEVASQINVYLEDSTPTDGPIGTTYWATRVRVECVARAATGLDSETVADALAVQVHARLLTDPSLGGLAIDTVVTSMAWTDDELETSLSACQQLFQVTHATPTASITA
jgi:hypothetical protein